MLTNREKRLKQILDTHPSIFKTQGAIVSGWRYRDGKTFGPYYRLVWREDGQQKSFHLGGEGDLVEFARQYLRVLRAPRRREQAIERTMCRLRAARREALGRVDKELSMIGLRRKGSEIRRLHPASKLATRSPGPPKEESS
jgi:hypothetical protein